MNKASQSETKPTKEEIAIELSTAKDWKILAIESRKRSLTKKSVLRRKKR